jgi:hypothetical protein
LGDFKLDQEVISIKHIEDNIYYLQVTHTKNSQIAKVIFKDGKAVIKIIKTLIDSTINYNDEEEFKHEYLSLLPDGQINTSLTSNSC